MKILLALSALVAVALADSSTTFEASYFPSTPSIINTDPSLKVVNGFNAERGQFKYQISLQRRVLFSFSHICGGSIVAPNWILTAAHCVSGTAASSLQVVAGILLLNENVADRQTVAVSQITVHEGYPGGSQVAPDDIAILRLAHDLVYGPNVQPIRIPRAGYEARGNVELSGWGLTRSGGSTPNHLQWFSVPVVEERECKQILDGFLTPSRNPFSEALNVCSGIRHGGESACNGDSGGPLAQQDYVVGVVSWGLTPCGEWGSPSVYAKVSAYAHWIEDRTQGEVRPY